MKGAKEDRLMCDKLINISAKTKAQQHKIDKPLDQQNEICYKPMPRPINVPLVKPFAKAIWI